MKYKVKVEFGSQHIKYRLKLSLKAACRVIKGIACACTYWMYQNPFTSPKKYSEEGKQ